MALLFRPLTTVRNVARFREITNILVRHGFGFVLDQSGLAPRRWPWSRRPEPEVLTAPERLRAVIEEIGPTAIKLGQVLSTRADFVPPAFLDELQKLQDTVPPFPFAQVRETIEFEFGQPIEALFSTFDPAPVAAASLSQVHRAMLTDGSEVAVKVQRPGIVRTIDTDIDILTQIAALLERRTDWAKLYNLNNIMEEFGRVIREELDFSNEGRNADQFARNFADNPSVRIPAIHWTLSSRKVLTMQWLDGVKITDVATIEALGIDRARLSKRFARANLEQILLHGLFHADPHPGNVMVGTDGVICFLDFGMVGVLDDALKDQLVRLVLALVQRDNDAIARALLDIGLFRRQIDPTRFRADLARLVRRYYNVPLKQIPISQATKDTLDLAYRYHLQLPTDMALLGRALVTMEGVSLALDPEISIVSVAEPFGKKLMSQRYNPEKIRDEVVRFGLEFYTLARTLPKRLDMVLERVQQGELKLNSEIDTSDSLEHTLLVMTSRISMAVIVLAGVIGSVLLLRSDEGIVTLIAGVASLAVTLTLSLLLGTRLLRDL